MNKSLDGNLIEIFLFSVFNRTDERILTKLTKTAANKSLNQLHVLPTFSAFDFTM